MVKKNIFTITYIPVLCFPALVYLIAALTRIFFLLPPVVWTIFCTVIYFIPLALFLFLLIRFAVHEPDVLTGFMTFLFLIAFAVESVFRLSIAEDAAPGIFLTGLSPSPFIASLLFWGWLSCRFTVLNPPAKRSWKKRIKYILAAAGLVLLLSDVLLLFFGGSSFKDASLIYGLAISVLGLLAFLGIAFRVPKLDPRFLAIPFCFLLYYVFSLASLTGLKRWLPADSGIAFYVPGFVLTALVVLTEKELNP
jgi:hypothetical protein